MIIALAALGLVLGLVFSGNVAEAEPVAGEQPADVESGTGGTVGEAPSDTPAATADDGSGDRGLIALAAAIAVGVAAAAGAIGMAIAIAKSNESIARQPEAKNDIRSGMMLGLVFIETAIIYALIIAILIIFVL
ncbi:MAG TPA: ATP synthase F0 subunit C [Candidatus Limadaptatus stercoravium]|nr:ATP synthase F0 subunit C [Candidatus Limadaptatus stercoravium]